MKNLIILIILVCSCATNAQIVQYVNISGNEQNFYKIGGYSFTDHSFPSGIQATPYVRTGPSPQNDFMYVATATGGIKNLSNAISTTTVGTSITLRMKNNNVRKFGANVLAKSPDGSATSGEAMILSVFTNQGNGQSYIFSNSSITWMGLVATGENEYIDSVKVRFLSASANVITIGNIMVGDDQAQNVSLNFDGVNDHVEMPSTVGNFVANQDFTVTCWVRVPTNDDQANLTNTDNDIIEKWDGNSGSYPFVIRYLNEHIANQNAGNVGKIRVARYDGINNPSITSSISIKDGKWHHIAFIRRLGVLQLRIDGASDGTLTDNTTNQTQNNSLLYIGSRGNINHFKGEIDEVRIWSVGKTNTESNEERFCKVPNTANLQAAYNFSEGVPHDNNSILITKVNSLVNNSSSAGTLSNFARTGDFSNFVNGQIIYIDEFGLSTGPTGYTWPSAFKKMADGLSILPIAYTCDDLLFDIHVARGTYKPHASATSISHNFPRGLKVYGGFSTLEKSVNDRNMALIHTTNKSTLSGDLAGNDTPFNFNSNRNENSQIVAEIDGNNVVVDGFTVKGGSENGIRIQNSNAVLRNLRIVDNGSTQSNNTYGAIAISNSTPFIRNSKISGNGTTGIHLINSNPEITNSLISNNIFDGIQQTQTVSNLSNQLRLVNCTVAANGNNGIYSIAQSMGSITNNIVNTILFDNNNYISWVGAVTNLISYSLVQNVTGGSNNLNGTNVVPNFINAQPFSTVTDAGDYRLKWCSLAINAGTNSGISPLDLDRNPRNFNGNADMGALEFLGNTPSQVNNSSITGTIDTSIYAGGTVQTISSTAKILAPAGKIDFKAPNSITLNPGFEARGMSNYFKAEIGANQTCAN
jgi:hypothetical protein